MKLTNQELGKNVTKISDPAMGTLLDFSWPGNVRELRNVIRRAVLMAEHTIDLPHVIINQAAATVIAGRAPVDPARFAQASLKEILDLTIAEVEQSVLKKSLELAKGNKAEAARQLKDRL